MFYLFKVNKIDKNSAHSICDPCTTHHQTPCYKKYGSKSSGPYNLIDGADWLCGINKVENATKNAILKECC